MGNRGGMSKEMRLEKIASRRRPKAKSTMRRFKVVKVLTVELSVDQRLLDEVLTDEWRASFYKLRTPADVADHLAYNLMQGRPLATLDGFADQPEERARLHEVDFVEDADEGTKEVSS
jgi:hypothetical protein